METPRRQSHRQPEKNCPAAIADKNLNRIQAGQMTAHQLSVPELPEEASEGEHADIAEQESLRRYRWWCQRQPPASCRHRATVAHRRRHRSMSIALQEGCRHSRWPDTGHFETEDDQRAALQHDSEDLTVHTRARGRRWNTNFQLYNALCRLSCQRNALLT